MEGPLKQRLAGFTMIELLVVITIVGILAALLLSGYKRVLGSADSAKCAVNLRTVGQAIIDYVNDNSLPMPTYTAGSPSQGQLPGPLNHGQMPVSSRKYKGMFAYMLYPYLGLPEPTSGDVIVPLLQCPAWKKAATNPLGVCYFVPNLASYVSDGVTNSCVPFGKYSTDETVQSHPMRVVALPSSLPLSQIVVMQDVDQSVASPGAWPYDSIPRKPIHNGRRNYLYLDGHVETQ